MQSLDLVVKMVVTTIQFFFGENAYLLIDQKIFTLFVTKKNLY